MKWSDIRNKPWYVYLIECSDGSYYCGITTSVSRRLSEHNSGQGAKYTRGRTPVKLLASINASSQSAALQIEAAVKKQRKDKKVKFLISRGKRDT
tara:strand:- start:348 stop:632 length:285 start_codon:yes stop_codon:yes gene_type:complete